MPPISPVNATSCMRTDALAPLIIPDTPTFSSNATNTNTSQHDHSQDEPEKPPKGFGDGERSTCSKSQHVVLESARAVRFEDDLNSEVMAGGCADVK